MRKLLLLMIAVITAFTLCACGESKQAVADPVVGRWKLAKLSDENETIEATGADTVYNFYQDGSFAGIDNGKDVKGTWKEVDTSKYTVMTDDSTMTFTLDGETLTYKIDSEMLSMNFIFERK